MARWQPFLLAPEVAALLGQTEEEAQLPMWGYTPLHHASLHGQIQKVKLLLEQKHPGSNVSIKNEFGQTPLHLAQGMGGRQSCWQGAAGTQFWHPEGQRDLVVQTLLDAGALVDARTNFGDTPLHFAAVSGSEARVHMLLDAGADIEQTENAQNTALHLAALYGRCSVVRLLLHKGADLNARNLLGKTPEDLASLLYHDRAAALLRVMAKRAWKKRAWNLPREAFAMGQHERLGARSLVLDLEPGVVRMILDRF